MNGRIPWSTSFNPCFSTDYGHSGLYLWSTPLSRTYFVNRIRNFFCSLINIESLTFAPHHHCHELELPPMRDVVTSVLWVTVPPCCLWRFDEKRLVNLMVYKNYVVVITWCYFSPTAAFSFQISYSLSYKPLSAQRFLFILPKNWGFLCFSGWVKREHGPT